MDAVPAMKKLFPLTMLHRVNSTRLATTKPTTGRRQSPLKARRCCSNGSNVLTGTTNPVPERKWAIVDRVPLIKQDCSRGEGGAGKSINRTNEETLPTYCKELAWLACRNQGQLFYLGAEDEEDELHRRIAAIAEISRGDVQALIVTAAYVFFCLLGKDATLCANNSKSGKIETTLYYRQLYEQALDYTQRNAASTGPPWRTRFADISERLAATPRYLDK